jgi:hypothetical protein
MAAAKRSASAGASCSGSRLASRVADAIASRLVIALARVPYLAAMTSPCSVMRMRPCTVPGGWARIAEKLDPPPRPTAPPRPWNSCIATSAFSNTGFSAVEPRLSCHVEVR